MKTLKYKGVAYNGYTICNKGHVYSKGVKLKPWDNGRGYLIVDISKDGETTRIRVHQASAETYHGERKEGMIVGHKDNNKSNNAPSNLYYITQRQNVADAQREIKNKAYLDEKMIKSIKRSLETRTIAEVAEDNDLAYHIVRDIKYGKSYVR